MIKVNLKNGKTKIEGLGAEILAEYSLITKQVIEAVEEKTDRDFALKIVRSSFETACMTEEELNKELLKSIDSLKDRLTKGDCDEE